MIDADLAAETHRIAEQRPQAMQERARRLANDITRHVNGVFATDPGASMACWPADRKVCAYAESADRDAIVAVMEHFHGAGFLVRVGYEAKTAGWECSPMTVMRYHCYCDYEMSELMGRLKGYFLLEFFPVAKQ